jgi:hypothetical protein
MSSSSQGTGPVPVVPTDCSVCLSAGSARRGVCDICGARVPAVVIRRPDEGELLLPA